MDKKKILVVEDEKAISDILVFNLQREGYDTLAAYDGAEGLRCALEEAPDLILLDVMLPEMDGFEVCRRVRAEKDTPIIMLTAREEETDKVMGLELGADDYITKPFSMRELMARVKANMRRTYAGEDREKAEAPSGGGLRVSKDNGMVYKNGHPLELSADAPIRPPFAAWLQGGITYPTGKAGVMLAAQEMYNKGLLRI